MKTVDLTAKGTDYLTYMWAIRQFAMGFVLGYAALKKSASMLTISFLLFLVVNIGEFFVGISQNDSSLYIGAGIMCIIALTLIYFINKLSK